MGILDDAIREHLDLKRKHGARDAEVQQLEDEAFGPPSRPDEPDFPDRPPTGEHPQEGVVVAEEPGEVEPEAAFEDAPAAVVEDDEEEAEAQVFYDQAGDGEPAPEPEAIAGEPTAEHEMVFEDEEDADEIPVAEALEPAPAAPPPERPPREPPLPEPPPLEPPPAEAPLETEAVEADADFEIGEIELEIDEEFEEFRETGDEAAEPPSDEHELVEPLSDEHEAVAPAPAEGDEDEEEDVLEETPEFLRGTPEDERLWFEQRPPQDFDFEDEDEDEK
jgi:hypothetical protein